MNAVVALPRAARWQPSRAGLISLWHYWDETFTFHNGRLLLRGPNGSGKSMALELLLPFLLDGDSSPARLTSSGRNRGRLFDRLMTGSDEQTRTGYAWVEFRRGAEVFTAGARIRGSQSTGRADVDLFTTTLAVGTELHLLDATRTPLSRRALIEAIGGTGGVHGTADEHRAAVREVLFPGFSAERYASLIGALLALRREKLSEKLDPDKLSGVLSEALPPLDDHDIAAVAEGFERLDRRRAELAALERDVDEVRALAQRQRAYARAVLADAAGRVRSAETVRDDVTRNERLAREELDAAQRRREEVDAERRTLDHRKDQIEVEVEALKDSDAYRAGASLADLRAQARQLRQHADRATDVAARRRHLSDQAARDAEDSTGAYTDASDNARRAEEEFRADADPVGADQLAAEALSLEPDDGERLVTTWIAARITRIGEVRSALSAHDKAVTRRDIKDEQVAGAERTVAERTAGLRDAETAEARSRDDYADAVARWVPQCATVGASRLRAALPQPARDPAEVEAAVRMIRVSLAEDDARAQQDLTQRRRVGEDDRAGLLAERARWESTGLVDPEPPPWRSSRENRPGAALWQLVDVVDGIAPADVDGLESALAAAGLLDAWVTPDGQVDLPPERADVQLTARPREGRTLRHFLAAAAGERPVTDSVLDAVLASVPVLDSVLDIEDATELAVATDGSYRLGSAVGRGPSRSAMLLGAVARERHRLARLAEIDAALADVDRRLAGLGREEAELQQRRTAIERELAGCPSAEPVVAALRAVTEAGARLAEASSALRSARDARRAAEDDVRAALRQLTTLAARHSLPADRAALDGIETALARLREAAGTCARRRRELATARRQRDRAVQAAERAAADAEQAAAEGDEREREAAAAEHRVQTLEASVGADYRSIIDRIDALRSEKARSEQRLRALAAEADQLLVRFGELRTGLQEAEQRRNEAEAARETAHRRFVAALSAFGPDAGTTVEGPLDAASAVLAAARSMAADRADPDGERQIERRSELVRERLHVASAALGSRVDFDRELTDEGWWVLRAVAGGLRRPVGDLADALSGQLSQARAELAAEEERLFEQTLAGSVRRALADRIRQANALVDGINDQLNAIRTAAAGVAVRLRWEVDPDQPAAVRSARTLLLQDPADLTEQERVALQEFVRARVDQARAELEANAPWEARLRESLDYRAWHRFTLQVAHRDWDGYQPATANRMARLSTGERSMALHLPMIASVAAHYADEDGRPGSCPRLILLDELFAGVDVANRAQLFGTFTTWQLDAVFTSDHEWCQYADLDGIAIHFLHPWTNTEPVTSTRFTWDGNRRRIDPIVA